MILAVRPEVGVRRDDCSTVVKTTPFAFGNAGNDDDVVLACGSLPGMAARPVRYGLGGVEGFVSAGEHVPGIAQLREHHQLRTGPSCGGDQQQATFQVLGLLSDARLHLDARHAHGALGKGAHTDKVPTSACAWATRCLQRSAGERASRCNTVGGTPSSPRTEVGICRTKGSNSARAMPCTRRSSATGSACSST